MKYLILICGTTLTVMFCADLALAQRDNVYVVSAGGGNSVVRGKVASTTAFKVTVETDSGSKDISSSQIKKISFSGEPRGLARARDHYDSGKFDDCLQAINKLESLPDSKFIRQEISYLQAYATGKLALRGDPSTSTTAAQQMVGKFVKENSDAYRLVRAVDLHAQLLMANGKTDLAQKEFNKLTKSRWPEFENRGYFFEGETLIHQGKLAAAKQSFQKLLDAPDTDEAGRQYKQLAKCQMAKLAALEGDVDAAVNTLEKIIRDESSDNTRLFAVAYNALGTCHLQSDQLKKACRAFLHTELLFATESDAHAEALYNLSKIWPKLNETERANRAKSMLTSRYRNTIWASKP